MKKQSKKEKQKEEKEKIHIRIQVKELIYTAILMAILLILFKFIPMQVYGKDILFDASSHITVACFILYFLWFFVDQNKSWRVPFFVFCFIVLAIISLQRILVNAHNDVGLLMGLIISIISILIPQWKSIKNKLDF